MAMTCSVCKHEKAAEINQMLATGSPRRTIANSFGLNESSIQRHREHLPSQVKSAVSRSKNAELRKTGAIWQSRLESAYQDATTRSSEPATAEMLAIGKPGNRDNPQWFAARLKAIEHGLRITGQMGSNNGSTIQVNVGCLVMPLEQGSENQEEDAIDVECEEAVE